MSETSVIQYTAKQIRRLRQSKGWSQENLALVAGLSVAYIGQIEREEKIPTIETLGKICSALEISLPQFFSFEDDLQDTDKNLIAIDMVISSMKSMPTDLAGRVALLVQEIKNLSVKS